MMTFFPTTFGKALLVLVFLTGTNLGSGYLAVGLGYPSLWGNTTGIFMEYAAPMPYNWALAHIVTMLPVAVAVSRLPEWDRRSVFIFRTLLGCLLITALLLEVKLPVGRLNHVPFLLFIIVDTSLALLLTLLFYPPIKTLLGLAAACLLLAGGLYFKSKPVERSNSPPAEIAVIESTEFFEEVTSFERHNFTEVFATIADTVGPDQGPTAIEICKNAESLAISSPLIIKFMAHPWFEPEAKYIYPAGEAELDSQNMWHCNFVYPRQASKP